MLSWLMAIALSVIFLATPALAAMKAGPGVLGRHHRLGGSGGVLIGNGVQAGLDFRFTTGGYYQQGQSAADTSLMTVARASSKSCDNQAGSFTTVGNNVLCVTNKGALIEEARTNGIRNNSMQGAVPGTPGTLPTNWAVISASGVVTSVNALTTVGGVDTIDLKFTGTTTGTFYVACFEAFSTIAGVAAQVWVESFHAALVGAGSGNITAYNIDMRQQGGAAPNFDSLFTPTSTLARYSGVGTLAASATFVTPCLFLSFTSGVVLNDTLRIGWPQLELGSFATSPIRTTNAAVTRAADVVTVTTSPIFGTAYTLFAQGTPNAPVSYGTNQWLGLTSNGTAAERVGLRRTPATGLAQAVLTSGGTDTYAPVGAVWSQSISGKAIIAAAAADQNMAFNGTLVAAGTAAMPVTPTVITIGSNGAQLWNGYLERIALWPASRLPNATLQSLTQ